MKVHEVILEKALTFGGYANHDKCISKEITLYELCETRALNLLYSLLQM